MPKILVLYVFHEPNERVKHFFENAIFQDNDVDFIVISNGNHRVSVPPYVKLILRPNIGYDFGGWSDALLNHSINIDKYNYFIFVNSSVIGPYGKTGRQWVDVFVNGLKDNIQLFGPTINAFGSKEYLCHVQSYAYSMNRETLKYLINRGIFSNEYLQNFNDTIYQKEIGMSRVILERGGNIGSLLNCYKGVNFVDKKKEKTPMYDDVMNKDYENRLWTRNELVFIKGNRDGLTL